MSKIIGIDLGTSNSAAAVLEAGKPKMIPSAEGTTIVGGKAFPSYVAFTKDGNVLVGEPARRQAVSNPEGTITAAKRKMGTNYKYKIYGKEYSPQEISAHILRKIKKDAEEFLGTKVEKAVITVPAYFDDDQRQATKDAGKIAGLDVVRIINEPTAAALAYGLDKQHKEQKILVFDLGAGTLDVTIMEFGNGVFEVKSTSGDTQLGGKDMDDAIVNYIVSEFKREQGLDLSKDSMAIQRVREAAEKAKIELSTVPDTTINLPYVTADSSGPKHLVMQLNRAKLEQLVEPIVKRCEKPIQQALADAKLTPSEVDKVILVGGPTRMPIIRQFIEKNLGANIERGVDPMECVAMGAAIQGGVLSGDVKDVLLLDVTPLTLGIETLGGVRTPLITRNTTIPVKKSQVFSTAADNQPAVDINVLQGERPMSADNKSIGRFQLSGIAPAPRGVPQIEVSFDIDANGILNVHAKDLGTGKEQKITIVASQKLDEKEVQRMQKEAEQHAAQDEKRKEEAEAVNNADALAYSSEKSVEELKGKVPEQTLEPIRKKIAELKEMLKHPHKDLANLKIKTDELNRELQAAGSELYKNAGHASQQGSNADEGNNSNPKDDNVVDADYTVEDNDKK